MPLARDFKETIVARVQRDARFRRSLLKEAIDALLSGDVDTGKTMLRDSINATQGFEELAAAIHKSPKSLMRMLGPRGNPQASNLLEILAHLQQREGLRFTVTSVRHDRSPRIGSSFEELLGEDGTLEEVDASARKRFGASAQ